MLLGSLSSSFLFVRFVHSPCWKSKSGKGVLLSGLLLYGCRVFSEAASKKDLILKYTRGLFWVNLFRQYCFIFQYIDKSNILLTLSILALSTTSAVMLMNPQDEVLRYKSRYVLYRKAHFLYKLKQRKGNKTPHLLTNFRFIPLDYT